MGGGFGVWRDGVPQPGPPNESVAALLVLLVDSRGALDRRQLADTLFPGSSPENRLGALRQTLFRLRRWLPDLRVAADHSRISLLSEVHLDLRLSNGVNAVGLALADGIDHPVIARFRAVRSEEPDEGSELPEELHYRAVVSIAAVDREAARMMLCGAPSVGFLLAPGKLAHLLDLTRPAHLAEPKAIEHLEMTAIHLYWIGRIDAAVKTYLRAFKLAKSRRDGSAMARAAAYLLFLFIEWGEMGAAREWLAVLGDADRTEQQRLLLMNARASFLWNDNRLAEAVEMMRAAEPMMRSASHWDRAHYFANRAVLTSEFGDRTATAEDLAAANEAIVGRHDFASRVCVKLVEATLLAWQAEERSCRQVLEESLSMSLAAGHACGRWYTSELRAELLARFGRTEEAWRRWRTVEEDRLQSCVRLTPRLEARKRRIRAICGPV